MKFASRLVLYYTLITLVSMCVVGIAVFKSIEVYGHNTVEQQLVEQNKLAQAYIKQSFVFQKQGTDEISPENAKRITKVKRDFFDATPRFRFINLVAEVAEILKGSYWVSNNSLENVYELLIRDVKNLNMTPEDREFVELVKSAVVLKSGR